MTKVRIPTSRCYLGAWCSPRDGDQSQTGLERAVTTVEAQIAQPLRIDQFWLGWKPPNPPDPISKNWTWRSAWDLTANRIPMLTMDVGPMADIANGVWDVYFEGLNTAFNDYAAPLFFRPWAEMDRTDLAWLVKDGPTYIAAWQRIHGIMNSPNITWVWCPDASIGAAAEVYYPGNAYVDWVGGDGYNWYPGIPTGQWREFSTVFTDWYTYAKAKPKPLMVAETGCQEDTPGRKAEWYTNMLATLKSWPQVKALVYFNSAPKYPWWIDSTPESLASFAAMASDIHMKPVYP